MRLASRAVVRNTSHGGNPGRQEVLVRLRNLGFGAYSLYPVPYRQFVFSIPTMLGIYFKYEWYHLTERCHCPEESLEVFFRTVLNLNGGVFGTIVVIHIFTMKIGDILHFSSSSLLERVQKERNGLFVVIPAKARIQAPQCFFWTPAFAGVTVPRTFWTPS